MLETRENNRVKKKGKCVCVLSQNEKRSSEVEEREEKGRQEQKARRRENKTVSDSKHTCFARLCSDLCRRTFQAGCPHTIIARVTGDHVHGAIRARGPHTCAGGRHACWQRREVNLGAGGEVWGNAIEQHRLMAAGAMKEKEVMMLV